MAVACLSVALSAGVAAEPPRDTILASYRGGEITRSEYASWRRAQRLADDAELRRDRLEKLALSEALTARAAGAGVGDEPAVRFQLAEMERDLLLRELRRAEDDAVTVSEEAVARALEINRAGLVKPRRVSLRNLLKRVPPGASAAQRRRIREEVEELRRELSEGADFASLARRESDSRTRFQGGLFGPVVRGELAPEIEAVAFALAEGELSPVIETTEGLTLLRCERIVAGRTLSPQEARERIRTGLRRKTSQRRWDELRARLLAAAAPRFPPLAPGESGGDERPVMEFATGRLSARELGWLAELAAGRRPAAELSPAARERLLEGYLFRREAARLARDRGLDSADLAEERAWRRRQILADELLERYVEAELPQPTTAEVNAFLEARRDRFMHPEQFDLSLIQLLVERAPPDRTLIRLRLDPHDLRRQLRRAEAIRADLRSGSRSFAEAARSDSRHPSADAGGRLGWISRRRLAGFGPAVFDTVLGSRPGEVSDVVRQDRSLYLLELHGRRAPRPMDAAAATPLAVRELRRERRAGVRAQVTARLIAELAIRVR